MSWALVNDLFLFPFLVQTSLLPSPLSILSSHVLSAESQCPDARKPSRSKP